MEELEALVILNSMPQVGSTKKQRLIQHYGSALEALKVPLEEIAHFLNFQPKVVKLWKEELDDHQWEHNLRLVERLHAQLVPYTSPRYPRRLLEIEDYPLVLYIQGTLSNEDERSISIVGTRQASIYGKNMAEQLSRELASMGMTVVSGLARGIDTAAHQGALAGGRTIAVLGSGLGSIYPSENKELAESISQKGALISEFPMAAPPRRHHFPQRNRIVSGLSMGTLLIEAPCQSGAILTAERAIKQKRPVFALPGRADLDSYKGNHALIKESKAKLIEGSRDILNYFELPLSCKSLPVQRRTISLENEERELLNLMPSHEVSIEELINRVQWQVAKLNRLLMSLVLKKIIKEYPGKFYKKIE